jgi:predicted RNA-binding protein with PIN domain
MQYIIDGHNLIPKLRGFSLSDLEDEQKLIDFLIPFLRAKKSRAMVFFDRSAIGQSGQRNYGLVKAFFVPEGQTADTFIANYVRQLAGNSRNHTLVSSDRMVQAAARKHHATILSSEQFADQLQQFYDESPVDNMPDIQLSEKEIAEWESLFNQYGSQPPDGMSP